MINRDLLTDKLFSEEDEPFWMDNNEAAKQRLQNKEVQEKVSRRKRKYFLEFGAQQNSTVIRAFRILEKTKEGYKVKLVTDEAELNKLDRIYGSRGWALPLQTRPNSF